MARWIKKICFNRDQDPLGEPPEKESHISAAQITGMWEGNLSTGQRAECIRHLDHCDQCYELVDQYLHDMAFEDKTAREDAGNKNAFFTKKIQALAASILLFVIAGTGIYMNRPQVFTMSLALDPSFEKVLLENDNLVWTDPGRIKRLEALLQSGESDVKGLEKVVLKTAYVQTKDFFKPKLIIKITIKNHTAHIEILEKDNHE